MRRHVSKRKKYLVIGLILCLTMAGAASNADAKQIKKTKKIYLSLKTKKMRVGQTFKLKVKKVKPDEASKKVKWKSGNKRIATVSSSGVVKAKKAGTVKITAVSKSNKKVKAFCRVIVQPAKKTSLTARTPEVTQRPQVTAQPTTKPDNKPMVEPSVRPSSKPTTEPTIQPSSEPITEPTVQPSNEPTTRPDGVYTVRFMDYDDTVLKEETVEAGKAAEAPEAPKRIGYIFRAWDKEYDNVTQDLVIMATYEKDMTPAIIVGDAVAQPGAKTVQVPVYINSNPGILGMTLAINYDDNAMTLANAVNGDAFKDVLVLTKANALQNNCNFTWDGEAITKDNVKDGVMLLLVFDIPEDAKEGKYNVGFYYNSGDIVNGDLLPIDLELRNGTVTITKDASN